VLEHGGSPHEGAALNLNIVSVHADEWLAEHLFELLNDIGALGLVVELLLFRGEVEIHELKRSKGEWTWALALESDSEISWMV